MRSTISRCRVKVTLVNPKPRYTEWLAVSFPPLVVVHPFRWRRTRYKSEIKRYEGDRTGEKRGTWLRDINIINRAGRRHARGGADRIDSIPTSGLDIDYTPVIGRIRNTPRLSRGATDRSIDRIDRAYSPRAVLQWPGDFVALDGREIAEFLSIDAHAMVTLKSSIDINVDSRLSMDELRGKVLSPLRGIWSDPWKRILQKMRYLAFNLIFIKVGVLWELELELDQMVLFK